MHVGRKGAHNKLYWARLKKEFKTRQYAYSGAYAIISNDPVDDEHKSQRSESQKLLAETFEAQWHEKTKWHKTMPGPKVFKK